MKPKDKFNNPIYPKTFNILLGFARVLMDHGFIESLKKTNLFYYFDPKIGISIFANMRGTAEILIWSNPQPLFYAIQPEDMPNWKFKREVFNILGAFHFGRFSHCDKMFLDGPLSSSSGNGFCVVCGQDFQADGFYCSPQCKKADEYLVRSRCRVCGTKHRDFETVYHHLNYSEDKTIVVCRSCHAKIHHSNDFPSLKPTDKPESR